MQPILTVENIIAQQPVGELNRKPHLFARSARAALVLSQGQNIVDIVIKNPLFITTFCKHIPFYES